MEPFERLTPWLPNFLVTRTFPLFAGHPGMTEEEVRTVMITDVIIMEMMFGDPDAE